MKGTCLIRRNIGRSGRWVRGVGALMLLALGVWLWAAVPVAAGIVLGAGAFVLFEAIAGWCVLRACGIKTRW